MGWSYSDQWAAGFFDGEGCVMIGKRRRTYITQYTLQTSVSQRDETPLLALQLVWGGSIRPNGARAGQWILSGRQAEQFLRAIRPYTLVKAAVIDVALEYRATVGERGMRVDPAIYPIREAQRVRVQALNRGA